jgi:hypothetical protein
VYEAAHELLYDDDLGRDVSILHFTPAAIA